MEKETIKETKEHIGMWVTDDSRVRHNLLPNGRYDESRGDKESAYQGKYWVKDNHIEYKDDADFTADGDFKGDSVSRWYGSSQTRSITLIHQFDKYQSYDAYN